MTILQALKKYGPWLSMNELIEFTGRDKADLKEEAVDLLDKEKLQKTGKARGTKYGLATAKAPEVVDLKPRLLEVIESHQTVSRKALCEEVPCSLNDLRIPLGELVESGAVVSNGKRKGELFCLATAASEDFKEDDIDFPAKILEVLEGVSLSWKELCAKSGCNYNQLRIPIEGLIAEGRVATNGQKRNVRFHLALPTLRTEDLVDDAHDGSDETEALRIKVAAAPDPYRNQDYERPWRNDPTPWLESLLRKATREELYALEYALSTHRTSMDPDAGRRLVVTQITLRHDKIDRQIRYVEKEAS
jgi:hypothetical protein